DPPSDQSQRQDPPPDQSQRKDPPSDQSHREDPPSGRALEGRRVSTAGGGLKEADRTCLPPKPASQFLLGSTPTQVVPGFGFLVLRHMRFCKKKKIKCVKASPY
ncbi:hypothetical protein ANANG_G00310120, partial [Anguilla anguilla]